MKKNINRILVIIGALLLIIGSNSIWFNQYLNSDFQGSVRGIDRSEGNIFFYGGIVSLVLSFFIKRSSGKPYSYFFVILGLLSSFYFMNLANALLPKAVESSVGVKTIPTIWFYLLFFGSVLIALGGIMKIPVEGTPIKNISSDINK